MTQVERPLLVMHASAGTDSARLALPLEAEWLDRRIRQWETLLSLCDRFGEPAKMTVAEPSLTWLNDYELPRTYLSTYGGTGARAWKIEPPSVLESNPQVSAPCVHMHVDGVQWSADYRGRDWRGPFLAYVDLLVLYLMVAPDEQVPDAFCRLAREKVDWAVNLLEKGLLLPDGRVRDIAGILSPVDLAEVLQDGPRRLLARAIGSLGRTGRR